MLPSHPRPFLKNFSLTGERVLVTGSSGFIGSILSHSLHALGARVVGVDLETGRQPLGAGVGTLEWEFYQGDMNDPALLERALPGCAVVFNLAGRCGHLHSMEEPLADMHANGVAQLALLEGCRRWAKDAHVIFASSRQVYGSAQSLPVNETQPLCPVDVNGIHKMASDLLHLLYSRQHGLCTTVLRLTNTYGPGMNIDRPGRSFLGEWLRVLLRDEPLVLLGSGRQLRDLNHVDDVVAAFVRVAEARRAVDHEVFNLGGCAPISLCALAKKLSQLTGGRARWRLEPFPPQLRSIDIGDYWGDYTKIKNMLGWEPKTDLMQGLGSLLEAAGISGAPVPSPLVSASV